MTDLAFVDLAWTVWHEGIRIYDDGFPGSVRAINSIRGDAVGKQSHNDGARDRINNLSNNEIEDYIPNIVDYIYGHLKLEIHFRWVAFHEGRRKDFLNCLDNGDYTGIRAIYSGSQQHNPDARNLLAGVSNGHLKTLVDAL